jgi:hypothetical protein
LGITSSVSTESCSTTITTTTVNAPCTHQSGQSATQSAGASPHPHFTPPPCWVDDCCGRIRATEGLPT